MTRFEEHFGEQFPVPLGLIRDVILERSRHLLERSGHARSGQDDDRRRRQGPVLCDGSLMGLKFSGTASIR
jgi:hypothetical protein